MFQALSGLKCKQVILASYGDFENVQAIVYKPMPFPKELENPFSVEKAYVIKYNCEEAISREEAVEFEIIDTLIYLQVDFKDKVLNVRLKPVEFPKIKMPLSQYVNVYIVSW